MITPSGSITVATDAIGHQTAAYTLAQFDHPPKLIVSKPEAGTKTVNSSFKIVFDASDEDSRATVDFYYDTDAAGFNGVLIQSGVPAGIGVVVNWETSALPPGQYFVYALANDEIRPPVAVYSAGSITVDHTTLDDFTAPQATVLSPADGDAFR